MLEGFDEVFGGVHERRFGHDIWLGDIADEDLDETLRFELPDAKAVSG